MKKVIFTALFVLLCLCMAVATSAADTVVFVSAGASGDGSSPLSPVGTLAGAYAAIGNNDGKIVLMSDYTIAKATDLPAHTGTVTLTSVYDDVDYRKTNDAAIRYTASARLTFGSNTVIDGITVEVDSTANAGVLLCANYNDLTIRQDFNVVYNYANTERQMYLIAGPNNNAAVRTLNAGQTCNIEVYGGEFRVIGGFCRSVNNKTNQGTTNITLGGNTSVINCTLGTLLSGSSTGGSAVLNLQDSASVDSLYLAGASTNMNGSVTVNVSDHANIGAFVRYLKTYFPNGTRTLNYESTATLPANLTTYFDTVTQTDEVIPQNMDVVYVADGGTGDGTSAENPLGSLTAAYNLLEDDGGTIVICGAVSISSNIEFSAHNGAVVITSNYGGSDHRDDGACLKFVSAARIVLGSETTFKDLSIDIATTGVIAAAFHPVTFDTGITVTDNYGTNDSYGLYLVGGHNNVNNTSDTSTRSENTSITIKSGRFSRVVGFSRYCGARKHTGTATINLSGDAYANFLFAGAVEGSAAAGYGTSENSIINLSENAVIETLYTGGSNASNVTTGEVVINVDGGDIYEFDVISLDTSAGKVTVNYDPRTVADGVVELANLARFNVYSTCDIAGAHTFGAAFDNPFGGGYTAHTCEICGYTELIGSVPAQVANNVVFVADGGFGNGLSPYHPFGDLEDAFNALGTDGGTIVLCGECTLPGNLTWKISATNVSFQEPIHTGEVLITSVYKDADYRESGAKLIFNGNMHYRLSGPTIFDNIVFDTVGNPKTNLIAARYHPLTFGENCHMNKTTADGYQLWVVGGYQYFRYTDFIGVEIEDPLLQMITPARPVAWDFEPENLVPMSYTSGNGKTYTVTLEEQTAAAFAAMFADMEKEGLYVPYPGWNFRNARTQYSIFTNALGNLRAGGKSYAEAYHAVEISCSIPGSSEHQLGQAFDIYDERLDDIYGSGTAHIHYDETDEWEWMIEHAADYGLILRFLKTKTAQTGFIYEAWHFRYVGVEHAKAIANTDGYCLEEYIGQITGMFAKDACVTVKSGSFYQIMGGSRGCNGLTFTGKNYVTVDDDVIYTKLTDVDGEVGSTDIEAPQQTPLSLSGVYTNDTGALRFVTRVSASDALPEVEYFGTYIVPLTYFTENELQTSGDEQPGVAAVKYTQMIENGKTFAADLTSIPEAHFDTPIFAWSFVKFKEFDTVYVYTLGAFSLNESTHIKGGF